ncbi:unnamed protein product, partial [Urochloa humidicola]
SLSRKQHGSFLNPGKPSPSRLTSPVSALLAMEVVRRAAYAGSWYTSDVTEELKSTGKFELMDLSVDEAEHGFEMLLPYLSKVFQGHTVKVVPVLIGSLDFENETMYGQLLSKYLDDPKNFFVVSTDFCHCA